VTSVAGRAETGGTAAPADDAVVGAVADAYVWGYPLVVMHRTCAGQGGVGAPAVVLKDLATAEQRSVVAPNNDTLYSSAWYDLRRGDVTIDVGVLDLPDRYWSVMILDAYTNVRYVCRRLHGTGGASVRVTYDSTPTAAPDADTAADVVAVGTPTVWLLARVVVDGPDDLGAARVAQSRVRITQPSPSPSRSEAPPAVAVRQRTTGFLGELSDALAIDPPAAWHPAPPEGLDDLLRSPPSDEVVAAGVAAGEQRIAAGLRLDRLGNGWGTRSRGAAFGDDITYRASFARFSLAGHLPAENRSYTRTFDGTAPAVLSFPPGSEPPVDGLWSLCLYGPDLFFVVNPLDRYSIGDRTPGLRRDPDGGLSILIAAPDPDVSTRPLGAGAFTAAAAGGAGEGPGDAGRDPGANWLPAPAGPCFLALRAYEGRGPVVAADWFPPDLVPVQ
jgi:hypothetical protein